MALLRLPKGPEELISEAIIERTEEYRKAHHHDLAEAVREAVLGS